MQETVIQHHMPITLQAAHWANFPQYIPPDPVRQTYSIIWCLQTRKPRALADIECEVCKVALNVPECVKIYDMKKKY
jgi:hypothetical protein